MGNLSILLVHTVIRTGEVNCFKIGRNQRVHQELGVTLTYPTYREGIADFALGLPGRHAVCWDD